jgi:hypothetical protein
MQVSDNFTTRAGKRAVMPVNPLKTNSLATDGTKAASE